MYFWSVPKPVTHSRVLAIGTEMTERKIKKRIYKMLQPIVVRPYIGNLLRGNEDEERILEVEY